MEGGELAAGESGCLEVAASVPVAVHRLWWPRGGQSNMWPRPGHALAHEAVPDLSGRSSAGDSVMLMQRCCLEL